MKQAEDRLLALAGIFQAASLVDEIARQGSASSSNLETCIHSIFQTDAETIEAVFYDRYHLRHGLQAIVRQMTENHPNRVDVTRYVLQLMHLAGKLANEPQAVQALADGIELAKTRSETFGPAHANILAQLADLYSDNISRLSKRIMVNGEPLHLNNPDNVNKIRALLLSGVRAAWLWKQCGGKRRQMVFQRRKIFNQARDMLDSL